MRLGWILQAGVAMLDIAFDPWNSVIYAGAFSGTQDLDPTEGVDERTSASPFGFEGDILVTKLHADGSYAWSFTVEGPDGHDGADGVVTDDAGDIYVAGSFRGVVDFDPGPGVDEHVALDSFNAFLAKLGADGSYLWTRSFDGPGLAGGSRLARDLLGDLILAGSFGPTVDFDPGPSVEERTAVGSRDVYLAKFDPEGNLLWVRAFGGGGFDAAEDVRTDEEGNIFVMGLFRGRVDFDPGPGVDWHTGQGSPISDLFVSKYLPDGSYAWTRTLPTSEVGTLDVAPEGNVFLTGAFVEPTDFDPTDGVDIHVPVPPAPGVPTAADVFVTKLHGDGSYGWTNTFGGDGLDTQGSVAVTLSGDILVSGNFANTVSFDPGNPRMDRACFNTRCTFLLRMRSDRSIIWILTTQSGWDLGRPLSVDVFGNVVYVRQVGTFVDLDPTCGFELSELLPGLSYFGSHLTKLICGALPGDYDNDGDVDLADVAHLQNCFAGEAARECAPGCDAFDLDLTASISLADYTQLQPLLTNPN